MDFTFFAKSVLFVFPSVEGSLCDVQEEIQRAVDDLKKTHQKLLADEKKVDKDYNSWISRMRRSALHSGFSGGRFKSVLSKWSFWKTVFLAPAENRWF